MKFIDKQYKLGRSFIVEGVHVSEALVNRCLEKYDYVIPLFIYVNEENDHLMRFSSRCENGSVDPAKNRYAMNFGNIRLIQKSIMGKTMSNKFVQVENTDAKKAASFLNEVITKYFRELNNMSLPEFKMLAKNRKGNLLNESIEKGLKKINKAKLISESKKKEKIKNRDQLMKLLFSKEMKMLMFCRNDNKARYWFLKHNKIYHKRIKKYPLVKLEKRH